MLILLWTLCKANGFVEIFAVIYHNQPLVPFGRGLLADLLFKVEGQVILILFLIALKLD